MLRGLGDRALFDAGIFGDRLRRGPMDVDYYGEIGRAAYADLSICLAEQVREQAWCQLFRELARDFRAFVELLAGVGDRTRSDDPTDLLEVYEHYLETGSPRDRARLGRGGIIPIWAPGLRIDQ